MAIIKLEDELVHVVLNAVGDKLSELNMLKSVSGCLTDRMVEDLECLEDAHKEITESVGKTEKIYVVRVDDIPEEKVFSELTDDEVVELSYKHYDSVKGFLLDFNGDYLDPSSEFARAIVR